MWLEVLESRITSVKVFISWLAIALSRFIYLESQEQLAGLVSFIVT